MGPSYFIMVIHILIRRHLYITTAPRFLLQYNDTVRRFEYKDFHFPLWRYKSIPIHWRQCPYIETALTLSITKVWWSIVLQILPNYSQTQFDYECLSRDFPMQRWSYFCNVWQSTCSRLITKRKQTQQWRKLANSPGLNSLLMTA